MASRFGSFKVDRAGVAATFRSSAMQGALKGAASKVAASANASAAANKAVLPTKWQKIVDRYDRGSVPYTPGTKVLRNTAVGTVRTSSLLGVVDENRHHTLEGSL